MNRRKVLQMTGIGAAAAIAPVASSAEQGVRLYEVAIPSEIERVFKLPYWESREDFKIIMWNSSHAKKGSLTDMFNELSIAGYHFVECTYCDGISGQYVFARRVPREVVS